jgi:probable rRNA maturation factor
VVIIKQRIPALSQAALARFVSRARHEAGLTGVVNVMVTSSRELRRLNLRFRGKDEPTDVLSFPAIRGCSNGLTGDVAISAEIAAYNARRLGHTAAKEIKILALHGILHLAGYDHERDDGEMAVTEARLRRTLNLPVALLQRNSELRQARKSSTAKNPQRSQTKARSTRKHIT